MAGTTRRARAANRRRRRMGAVEHDLDAAQWAALQAAWGGCAYCGAAAGADALQRDCVLPISRGGRYTWDNVVPACRSCNASKCNTEVTAWLRRKRLDERQFLLRHSEVRAGLLAASSAGRGDGSGAGPGADVGPDVDDGATPAGAGGTAVAAQS